MQITCRMGEEIRNGRLTGKLYRTLGMTGYVPDVLASIDGVAGDFAMSPGMCGKGHKEWVANGTGGPHLRMTVRLG
jgi:TldD protein